MRSKIYLLCGISLALLFSLASCKPKESAYKAAYEAAKARQMEDSQYGQTVEETTPVDYSSSTAASAPVQKEKVTVIDGSGILQYSVVIGSFQDVTNARSLKERMASQGFNSFLARNEMGMYRVIVGTFNDRVSAVNERNKVKDRYYPSFQDAWILDKQ